MNDLNIKLSKSHRQNRSKTTSSKLRICSKQNRTQPRLKRTNNSQERKMKITRTQNQERRRSLLKSESKKTANSIISSLPCARTSSRAILKSVEENSIIRKRRARKASRGRERPEAMPSSK